MGDSSSAPGAATDDGTRSHPLTALRLPTVLRFIAGMLVPLAPIVLLGLHGLLGLPSWVVPVALVLAVPGAAVTAYATHVFAKAQGVSSGRVLWRRVTAPFRFFWNLP